MDRRTSVPFALLLAFATSVIAGDAVDEYILREVKQRHAPGAWLSGLKRQPDPDPRMTEILGDLLKSVAEGGNPDRLARTARAVLTPMLRAATASRLQAQTAFEFIGEERCGPFHFVLDSDIDRFRWYRMVTGGGVVYYTFNLARDGKVVGLRAINE